LSGWIKAPPPSQYELIRATTAATFHGSTTRAVRRVPQIEPNDRPGHHGHVAGGEQIESAAKLAAVGLGPGLHLAQCLLAPGTGG
jgi:hypothetical protein